MFFCKKSERYENFVKNEQYLVEKQLLMWYDILVKLSLEKCERSNVMSRFVLASASPRRTEILNAVGLEHIVMPANADETVRKDIAPEKYVMELALLKGADVAKNLTKSDVVIAADTVVVYNGEIMGKPKDENDALRMLLTLSGNVHSVLTGYCVIRGDEASVKYEETKVKFRSFGRDEAERYIKSGECTDKAGAYGIQGKGRLLVEKIDGDYFNVVGLPICALAQLLKSDFNIDIL